MEDYTSDDSPLNQALEPYVTAYDRRLKNLLQAYKDFIDLKRQTKDFNVNACFSRPLNETEAYAKLKRAIEFVKERLVGVLNPARLLKHPGNKVKALNAPVTAFALYYTICGFFVNNLSADAHPLVLDVADRAPLEKSVMDNADDRTFGDMLRQLGSLIMELDAAVKRTDFYEAFKKGYDLLAYESANYS